MKKEVFFAYLKIALSVLFFNVSTIGFADSDSRVEYLIKTENKDVLSNSTNHSILVLVESKLEVNIVLFPEFKNPSNFHSSKNNTILEFNKKTNKLSYNFVHVIIPSLGSIKIIYPFHSFY
jgi:hypothetical protein